MAKFAGEYYGASIDVRADKSRPFKSAVHQTMAQVKKARDANNKRNNDVYGSNRANGLLFDVQSPLDTKDGWYITNPELTEMSVIGNIDSGEQYEKLTLVEYLSCRAVMATSRVQELDLFFSRKYKLKFTEIKALVDGFNSGEITKRKIDTLIEMKQLKLFLSRMK